MRLKLFEFSHPFTSRAGHDVNYMALAGLIGLSGKSDSVPPLPGFQGADATGAMQVIRRLFLAF